MRRILALACALLTALQPLSIHAQAIGEALRNADRPLPHVLPIADRVDMLPLPYVPPSWTARHDALTASPPEVVLAQLVPEAAPETVTPQPQPLDRQKALAATTTTLTAAPSPSTYGTARTLTATVASTATVTGTVNFTEGATALCSAVALAGASATSKTATCVVAANATTATAGAHTYTAAYGGNATAAASSGTLAHTINKATPTVTLVSDLASPTTVQSFVLTATMSLNTATGNVDFKEGATVRCAGVTLTGTTTKTATCTIPATTVGAHTYTSNYLGDANHNTATVTKAVTVVALTASTMAIAVSPSPSIYGATRTLTATITPAATTGTVNFTESGTTLIGCGAVALTGTTTKTATCIVAATAAIAGAHTYAGAYSGDTTYATSSGSVAHSVNKATAAVATAATPATPTVGQSVLLTATVTPSTATGNVDFKEGATVRCAAVALTGTTTKTATCTIAAANATQGAHTYTTNYLGDSNHNTATVNTAVTVAALTASATAVAVSPSPSTYGATRTLTATITPAATTGTVNFTEGGTTLTGCGAAALTGTTTKTAICVVAATAATAGAHTYAAAYSGDGSYATSSGSIAHTVNKATATASVISMPASIQSGQAFTLTATINPNTATGTVAFTDGATSLSGCTAVILTGTTTKTAICNVAAASATTGTHTYNINYAADFNHTTASASLITNIVAAPGASSVALTANPNPGAVGQSVVLTATVTPNTATGSINFTESGSTLSGCGAVALTGTTTKSATCTVASSAVTLGAHAYAAVYGGDGSLAGSNGSLSFTVGMRNTTVTTVVNPAAPVSNQPFTIAATVADSAATGSITVGEGGTTICNALPLSATAPKTATCNMPGPTAASHIYTVSYSGDSNVNSASTTATVGVTAAPDDDDDGILPIIIAALRPKCDSMTATPSSVTAGASFALSVNCTFKGNLVKDYVWAGSGVPNPTLTTVSNYTVSAAPTTAGTYAYSVLANNGNVPGALQSVNVTVTANAPPTVTIARPFVGEHVGYRSAPITGSVNANDTDSGIASIQITIDGANWGTPCTFSPPVPNTTRTCTQPIRTDLLIGSHTFGAVAVDALGTPNTAAAAYTIDPASANCTLSANPASVLVGGNAVLTATCTVFDGMLGTTIGLQGASVAWSTTPACASSTATTDSSGVATCTTPALSTASTFSVAATKPNYAVAGASVSVAIAPANSPPKISALLVTSIASNTATIRVTATDPDSGNTLTASAAGATSCTISGGFCDLVGVPVTLGVTAVTVTVSDGLGGTASSTIMLTNNQAPSASLANPTPDGTLTSTVGTTAGSFAVGEGGAASYSIPIQVPPGVNGVQPNLALVYNSQGGDGFVGVGWSLSGVSSIARCPKNYAQDGTKDGINYDDINNDAYCVDGQRLVPVTAGDPKLVMVEYRTEVDSYSRIRSEPWTGITGAQPPGPFSWTIVTKSGQTMRFGTRQIVFSRGFGQTNRLNSAKTWLLNELSDSFSNLMLIDYAGSNADTLINIAPVGAAARASPDAVGAFPYVEYWPSVINYHGAGYNPANADATRAGRVSFEVECRDGSTVAANGCPASELTYFDSGAGEIRSSRRLKRITVSAFDAGTQFDVRNYTVNYSASQASARPLVQSIQECAGNTQSTCLPPTSFSWSSTTANTKQFVEWGANTGTVIVDFANTKISDFNGDGRSDYFRYVGGMNWEQCLSTGVDFVCTTITLDTSGLTIESDPGQPPRFFVNDMNGDGYADITMFYGTGPFLYRFAFTCNGGPNGIDASSCASRQIVNENGQACSSADSFCDAPNAVQIADLDGDGIMDIMIVAGVNGVGNALKHCFLNQAQTQYVCRTNLEFGNPSIANSWDFVKRHMLVGDFDGDGKVDVIRRYADSDTNDQWRTFLSDFNKTAAGTTSGNFVPIRAVASPIETAYITAAGNKIDKLTVMDFNGDGLADMASQSAGNNWLVCLATGDGSFQLQDPTLNWSPTYSAWVNAAQDACYATNTTTTGPNSISCGHIDNAARCRLWATTNRAFDKIIWGDFNGDGRTDQATFLSGNTLQVCLSRGNQFGGGFAGNACETWALPADASSLYSNWDGVVGFRIVTGDFDGDGRTDIAIVDGNNKMRVLKASTNAQPVDVISQITTGLGATTGIAYKPITDSSVYSSSGTPAAGEIKLQSPMYVVKSTDASNAQGGYFTTSYFYEDLRAATNGRGTLGFGKRRMIDGLGIVTESTYNNSVGTGNAWAIAGRPVKATKWAPTSTSYTTPNINTSPEVSAYTGYQLVNRVTSTWAVRTSAAGYVGVAETHGTSTIDESWELDAANFNASRPLTRNTTSSAFGTNIDSYGNVLSVTTTAEQEFNTSGVPLSTATFTKTTSNTYHAASASALGDTPFTWVVGRLKDTTVAHTGGTGNITRKSAFTYAAIGTSPGTCSTVAGVLCMEQVEPDRGVVDTSSQGIDANRDLYLQTTYAYDGYGNRTTTTTSFYDRSITGALAATLTNRSTTMTYGYGGRFPTSIVNAAGHTESRNYDVRFGGVTKLLGPNNLLSETIYDSFGRKVRERSYTSSGGSGETLTPAGSTVSDAVWKTTATSACGNNGSYTLTRTVSGGPQSQVTYDNLQREVCSRTVNFGGNWSSAVTNYDAYGRKSNTSKPVGQGTLNAVVDYDSLSRPVCEYSTYGALPTSCAAGTVSATLGTATKATTSYAGLTTSTTVFGANGGTGASNTLTTSRTKNNQGWVTSAVDANAQTTSYTYNGIGNLMTVTTPGGYGESFGYDVRGRKTSMSSPDAGSYSYKYNGAGELSEQIDGRSWVSRTVFDSLGRVTERREYENAGTGAYFRTSTSYDGCTMGKGKLCDVTSGYDTATRTASQMRYDSLGRPATSSTAIDGKSFTSATAYDALGRSFELGTPGGIVFHSNYQSTGGQYVTHITQKDSGAIHWQANNRNDDGSIASMTVGGIATSKTYDGLGRISGITAGPSNAVQGSTFSFDAVGNLITRSDSVNGIANASFTYDTLNRLSVWTDPNGTAGSAGYSVDGNLTSKTGVTSFVYTAGTHRLSSANGASYSYEGGNGAGVGNGNVASVGSKVLGGYTAFNLPAYGTSGASRLDWLYDAGHGRIREVSSVHGTTYFMGGYEWVERDRTTTALADSTAAYSGCLEERTYLSTPEGTLGVITRRANCAAGVGTNTAVGSLGDPAYWHRDHLGSLVASTNVAGSVTARFRFDPWGKRECATLNGSGAATGWAACNGANNEERGFTGHEMLDELGFVHMNGRLFDPLTGRMLQADPIVQDAYNAQNYNRYSYVMNNPLSYTDPTGFSWWTKWRAPIIAIAASIVTMGAASAAMAAFAEAYGSTMFYTASAITDVACTAGSATTLGSGAAAAAGGFAAGGISGGNLQSAVQGAITATLTFGVGELSGAHAAGGSASMTAAQKIGQVAGHAAVGCASAAMAGGSCKAGAMAQGFSALAGHVPGVSDTGLFGRAVIGALASRAGGGKAENGALSAAFEYLFNELKALSTSAQQGWGSPGDRVNRVLVGAPAGNEIFNRRFYLENAEGNTVATVNGSVDPDYVHQPNCANGCPRIASGATLYSVESRPRFGGDVLVLGANGTVTTAGSNPNQNGALFATHVYVHKGYETGTYAEGCLTVSKSQWDSFIGHFRRGEVGVLKVIR